ncbi:hypothetical protein CR513_03590, partial [Mucuna pruriens]
MPIPISYSKLLQHLLRESLIAMVHLKPMLPPYPKSYNLNAKCDYHVGVVGHSTKRCWALKHKVQDLIDIGWLHFKEDGPNINNNPLQEHRHVPVAAMVKFLLLPAFKTVPCKIVSLGKESVTCGDDMSSTHLPSSRTESASILDAKVDLESDVRGTETHSVPDQGGLHVCHLTYLVSRGASSTLALHLSSTTQQRISLVAQLALSFLVLTTQLCSTSAFSQFALTISAFQDSSSFFRSCTFHCEAFYNVWQFPRTPIKSCHVRATLTFLSKSFATTIPRLILIGSHVQSWHVPPGFVTPFLEWPPWIFCHLVVHVSSRLYGEESRVTGEDQTDDLEVRLGRWPT